MRTPAYLLSFALIMFALLVPGRANAQDAAQRMIRTYVPKDQLVSFLPSTPFNTFIEFVNPIFRRVTGKEVIDVEMRDHPIGISISTMHFLDALELVLKYNDLQYRETQRYFMIQEVPAEPEIRDSGSVASVPGAVPTSVSLANLDSRQIEINAVLFEVNHTKARESGMDWSLIFGSTGGTSGGASAGGGGATNGGDASEGGVNFSLKTDKLFSSFDDIITSPNEIKFSDLNRLFRLAEAQGFGETVASPSVTVQSGVAGDIQIGSDVPVQTRDFSGNTVTELFKTGIIVNVTPTLITEALADTLGSPTVDFLHLAIQVEKSGSRPSAAGPVIDRSSANTQVVLLDGEQTVIGGLFSTDETISRSGIPLLKDLPGWFFGLRYVFGKSQRQITQKELVIAIEARIVDPVRSRYARSRPENMLEQQRAAVRRALEQFNADLNTDVQKGKMN
jgi:type IV pilus assembly protein PilQ